MTAPPTVLSAIFDRPLFQIPRRRRLVFAAFAVLLAVLSVFPRHYVARAELLPQDANGGLSSLLNGSGGGLLGIGALLGSHPSIDSYLAIGQSEAVTHAVARRLRLDHRSGYGGAGRAEVKLRKKVDIAALRGGIIQVTAKDGDAALARSIVDAYVETIRTSLTALSLRQVAERRDVAQNRLNEAVTRLVDAQQALGQFRAANRLAAPEAQFGAAVSQLANLQGRLQATQVELDSARRFQTSANVGVQALEAEVSALRAQIAQAQQASSSAGAPNLTDMASKTTQYYNLYRNEKFAEALYEVYTKYLEQVTVDSLSANATIDVIEPPYVDPARQYNLIAAGALMLLVLFGALAEFYAFRPPVGR